MPDLDDHRFQFWFSPDDHEVAVFDLKTSGTYVLDENAARLLNCIQSGSVSQNAMLEQLLSCYPDTPLQELEGFVNKTLEEFETLGLLDPSGAGI